MPSGGRGNGDKSPMPRKLLILIFMTLALSSCTALRLLHSAKLKAPKVSFVAYRFIGADASQANLEFTLAAYNPNTIGLRNVNVGYELFHQNRRFLHGGDALVAGNPTVYNEKEAGGMFQFSLKLSRSEDVPIPDRLYKDAGKAAMRSLRKMF